MMPAGVCRAELCALAVWWGKDEDRQLGRRHVRRERARMSGRARRWSPLFPRPFAPALQPAGARCSMESKAQTRAVWPLWLLLAVGWVLLLA